MPATYEPIQSYTISGSTTATVDFTSIPQTYTDLILIGASGQTVAGSLRIRLNGITTTSYSNTRLEADGTTVSSSRNTNENFMKTYLASASNTYGVFSIFNLFNYTSTSINKTALFNEYRNTKVIHTLQLFRNTAAITQINLSAETDFFVSGSTFTLYGIKAA